MPELKIDCACRKPKPGLLYQAAKDFHIDLAASYMVGDGDNDVQCGINAGCTPVLLTEGEAEVAHYRTLLDFVNHRIDKEN